MRYSKAINVWAVDPRTLQRGQWVYAGSDDGAGSPTRGRYCGVKPSGVVVVAWMGNARRHASVKAYVNSLNQYARAV